MDNKNNKDFSINKASLEELEKLLENSGSKSKGVGKDYYKYFDNGGLNDSSEIIVEAMRKLGHTKTNVSSCNCYKTYYRNDIKKRISELKNNK